MNNNNVLASDCIKFKDSSADENVCYVGWVEKWVKWNTRLHDY